MGESGLLIYEVNGTVVTSYAKRDGDRTYLANAELLDTEGKTYTPDKIITEIISNSGLFKEGPRQKNLKLKTEINRTLGFPCVRFDLTSIDPNVPNRPGGVYKLDAHGFYCSHPKEDGVLVNIVYSRRTPKEKSYVGVAEEGEHFITSIQFTNIKR